jgi:N-methylhydantoinase A
MIEAIRLVSVERGHDPRDFALLAFGGAGGLHACDIARELQIATVIVPENQGVLSALGLLVSDYRHDLVQTMLVREREIRPSDLVDRFAELSRIARNEFARYGLDERALSVEASVGLRYVGQASELDISVVPSHIDEAAIAGWVAAFHSQYRRRFGHSFPDKEAQVVNLRVAAVRPAEVMRLPKKPLGTAPELETGHLYFRGAWTSAHFAWRPALPANFGTNGPLIVEDHFATTFVPAGWRLRVHENGTLVLTDHATGG